MNICTDKKIRGNLHYILGVLKGIGCRFKHKEQLPYIQYIILCILDFEPNPLQIYLLFKRYLQYPLYIKRMGNNVYSYNV